MRPIDAIAIATVAFVVVVAMWATAVLTMQITYP